jgi:acetyl-CoA carboxylase/biotin carboxylase 1
MSYNDDELATNFVQVSNEVPGSPMFMMQLCTGARHLEVQIVGDEHGNAVAINGRDCSTQRRFQKIFEEGPPTIAKPDTFREMEKAAQRLTQSIGYTGAGTVEYLYKAETDEYAFLELNPRLQVEHPVTEGISGVNMPATQLQVAMGIPLNQIPDVRRFYGKKDFETGDSAIDFLEEEYKDIDSHVIAARITAENPDEGFKPTSGTIERVKFQSTTNVWGYFSVGANGGIHEFADSQFGHLFAKGPNREAARKSLVLALKEIEVRGDIRTTVDYLVQLLETDEFKSNDIDTSWLDGLIKEKSVSTELDPHTTVAGAAVYRAFSYVKEQQALHVDALSKGQLSMGALATATAFPVEISYKDTKYSFDVERLAEDQFKFTINGESFVSEVREQPDGALLASFGGATRKIVGQEDALGLRVTLDGTTCLLPTIFDPSELRTDVTGKIVRYLHGDGDEVEVGEPYVEVEAMKMIMPLKASESGAIKHELSPGSIISAGDMLASLALKDPSKVKKIETFSGSFEVAATTAEPETTTLEKLKLLMAGYSGSDGAAETTQTLVQESTAEDLADALVALLDDFLAVEQSFSGQRLDAANMLLLTANKDDLGAVITLNLAHRNLGARQEIVMGLLRAYEAMTRAQLQQAPKKDELKERLVELTELAGGDYAALELQARMMLDVDDVEPFESRLKNLRKSVSETKDIKELAYQPSLSAGVDLSSALFTDDDASVRANAVEAFVRRVYRAHTMLDFKVTTDSSTTAVEAAWTFTYSDTAAEETPERKGYMAVLPSEDPSEDVEALNKVLGRFAKEVEGFEEKELNNLHLSFGEASEPLIVGSEAEEKFVAAAEALILAQKDKLTQMGVRQVNLMVPQIGRDPRYFTMTSCEGFKEDKLRRDMRPTFVYLLELSRLQENYAITRFPALGRNSQVYLGVEKATTGRGPKPQVLFMRSVSHDKNMVTSQGAYQAMLGALDQLDRSMLDSRVTMTTSSRVFVNMLAELDMSPEAALENFRENMSAIRASLAPRLLKNKVDEVEIKVRLRDDDGKLQSVRLVASSMGGKWLDVSAFIEYPDPITGVTKQFCPINEDGANEEGLCFLDPYPSSNKLQMKRAAVRRISSTYAYDFLGLMEVELIQRWGAYLDEMKEAGATPTVDSMPMNVFESKELIFDENGVLRDDIERVVGTNDVGMLAWHCTMKTPEYPEGREMVIIANDVTVQSGSFGVKEDDFFEAASLYSRNKGLPRLYIACNSGARIGLVESLKPLFKVAWKDESNPAQGFDYLYLSEEDYKGLPEGTVGATKTTGPDGETRYALDDIIGQIHGIGVENLRGSGTIAGETARAYDETFTLSYVTGRSVGIGAYLVRLGQRTIQMDVGPMILTGYSALNKLLGREVYTSQDQLGGPQVMFPNGVSHEIVSDDQAGVKSIMDWLSYTPKSAFSSHSGALQGVSD